MLIYDIVFKFYVLYVQVLPVKIEWVVLQFGGMVIYLNY